MTVKPGQLNRLLVLHSNEATSLHGFSGLLAEVAGQLYAEYEC
jgi:hypothetical protein